MLIQINIIIIIIIYNKTIILYSDVLNSLTNTYLIFQHRDRISKFKIRRFFSRRKIEIAYLFLMYYINEILFIIFVPCAIWCNNYTAGHDVLKYQFEPQNSANNYNLCCCAVVSIILSCPWRCNSTNSDIHKCEKLFSWKRE